MNINDIISKELCINIKQIAEAIRLIDEGNTIPFIARYRKEMTGSLDDTQLRQIGARLTYLRNLEDRKQQVIDNIENQGKLTEDLRHKITSVTTLVEVEDLYLPYKQKRKTRATIAKSKGLEPLADIILAQEQQEKLEVIASKYIGEDVGVGSVEEAISGASDIIAERISDNAEYRDYIRRYTCESGRIVTSVKADAVDMVYEMYHEYEEVIKSIPPHRILAINRGEREKILNVKLEVDKDHILPYINNRIVKRKGSEYEYVLNNIIEDGYKRLIAPTIERDIRNELTDKAQDSGIAVFGKNLTGLLLQSPVQGRVVLGWDPAYRTGCKLAVVDATGKVLDKDIIYATPPKSDIVGSKSRLIELITKYDIELIALGNGTASGESEQIIAELIKEKRLNLQYVIVNEAGASVYSASQLGAEEFPKLDVGYRSAISIARRLQDPLAELVKIDPKSIGVGQYQHDMNQKKLEESLRGTVEDCVNKVGVDINTASPSLLSYVAGIGSLLAKNIVRYREDNGTFRNINQLKKVAKLGPKAFMQSAGFMRIKGGDNPLDATGVHPESYDVAIALLARLGIDLDTVEKGRAGISISDADKLATELGVGVPTLVDIIEELNKPGRDPRENMPLPNFKKDILSLEDLEEGMIMQGTVRNVIDFGAFIDIGVHRDGLVHISQLCERYVKHPLDVVSVGDNVRVKVIGVDKVKNKLSLSMKL